MALIISVTRLRYDQMLRTFAAPFDFHAPKAGRTQFDQLASSFSLRFDCEPQIVSDPVFSYTQRGRTQLDRLRQLDKSRPAIVYLSNVVMHSAILIQGQCDASDLTLPFFYESLSSFCDHPFSCGFGANYDLPLKSTLDCRTVVLSNLARFRDDDNELPDHGIFRVLDRIDDVFVCNILDYDRYFDHVSIHGDEPFFLNADPDVDIHKCVQRLGNDSLREYLLEQSVPFATLGDDHMDDEYAVSYGMACWRFGDDDLAFAR